MLSSPCACSCESQLGSCLGEELPLICCSGDALQARAQVPCQHSQAREGRGVPRPAPLLVRTAFHCSACPHFGPCQPAPYESVQPLFVGEHAPGTISSGQASPSHHHHRDGDALGALENVLHYRVPLSTWFFCSSSSPEHKHLCLGLQSPKSHRVQLSSAPPHLPVVDLLGFAGFLNGRPGAAHCWTELGTKVKSREAESNTPGDHWIQNIFPRQLVQTQSATTMWQCQIKECKCICRTLQMRVWVFSYWGKRCEGTQPPQTRYKERDGQKKSLFSKRHWQNNLLSTRSLNTI